ncbi:sigma-B regulation protein RsbQ [Microbacterium natoriense]|uniref:Sigma-B regulation protein RsbQ n=1 Tax=Microbacterium natoriense TaxID=284570 RepID=A0AAW8F118_9MICO|nr:alpha/beta hydrolase [Microbacterium natoriense]MDQ0648257.1 sigma-B regulation protein RsbQ [Microbacterium natoriense]
MTADERADAVTDVLADRPGELSAEEIMRRNAVTILGPVDADVIVFAHGYGTDQSIWRPIAETFAADHRVVLFDYVGSGASDLGSYDERRYDALEGYADDLIEVLDAVAAESAVLVAHSISGMIGALASIRRPELFREIVMVCPSPRYVDDEAYVGGFSRDDVLGLLAAIETNQPSWASSLAPAVTARDDRPEVVDRVRTLFATTAQRVAVHFARVVFFSDVRRRLDEIPVHCTIVQSRGDIICPPHIGEYLRTRIPSNDLVQLDSAGHFVLLTEPALVTEVIRNAL